MNHPKMTQSGRRLAGLIAVCLVLFLPKRVDCDHPAANAKACVHTNVLGRYCTEYEVEPFGFYLLERVLKRDVGFAYKQGEDCR